MFCGLWHQFVAVTGAPLPWHAIMSFVSFRESINNEAHSCKTRCCSRDGGTYSVPPVRLDSSTPYQIPSVTCFDVSDRCEMRQLNGSPKRCFKTVGCSRLIVVGLKSFLPYSSSLIDGRCYTVYTVQSTPRTPDPRPVSPALASKVQTTVQYST